MSVEEGCATSMQS